MITHFKSKQPQNNSMINVSSLTALLRQTVSHCHQYILTIAADNKSTQLHQRHQYRTCPSIQPNLQHTLIIMVSHHTNTQNNHQQQHQLLISPTTTSKHAKELFMLTTMPQQCFHNIPTLLPKNMQKNYCTPNAVNWDCLTNPLQTMRLQFKERGEGCVWSAV